MKSDHKISGGKLVEQKYFVAHELQLTLAVIVVIALFAGTFLQSAAAALSSYLGFSTVAAGVILVAGYVLIVAVLAVFYSHKLLGPFARLEYEMRCIRRGECGRRLTIRDKDDVHVRNFIDEINGFIDDLEAGRVKVAGETTTR